ncbi:hypothetical protein GGS20DRAFT_405661 [Poronia punctata]|nr:hypothetical protein GGS20DRAFT_405661 [Poronia punctata]
MAEEIPTIQVLDKNNYFSQKLIPLPDAIPYPALGPSSIRLRTAVLGLTVNNFTYAALGSMLNWWDVHPLPPSTPAPYNDASKYGRMNAWGYAQVIESTVEAVPKGSYVWGYVPLGTLAQDLEIRTHEIQNQIFVMSGYRQHVMPIYNRYFVYPPSTSCASEIAAKSPAIAYDVLVRVMHLTAHLMEGFVFSSDTSRVVSGASVPDDAAVWTHEDADLTDATVLVLAPGSKVGIAFAKLLRARTAEQGRPRRVVGVSSETSKAFVEGTDAYDDVVSTTADPNTIVQGSDEKRVVIFDFGGRAGVGPRWATAISSVLPDKSLYVGVGSEIIDPATRAARFAAMQAPPPFKTVRVNADDMGRRAIKQIGEEKYWAEISQSWERLRKEGIKGFGLTWGQGMEDLAKGWDRLARGDVLPSEGLAFKL